MAIYDLTVSVGSRAGGHSAAAKDEYIEREGRYDEDRSELEHSESGHMPEWAEDDAHAYWEAADEHERANGRLYREVEFALPNELDERERRELALEFAQSLTARERLPYTLAIHRGLSDEPGKPDNPHCHLMISERMNDGLGRTPATWFKRYNRAEPERGGALKSRSCLPVEWLENTRRSWAEHANRALERAGSAERIDHRTLAERAEEAREAGDLGRAAELSREPNVHLGPGPEIEGRFRRGEGRRPERSVVVETAREVSDRNDQWRQEWDGLERSERRMNDDIERLRREIAKVEERVKEAYERVRTAIDRRIRQARRAIRRGSEASVRASRAVVRAGATVGRAIRAGAESAHRVDEYSRRAHRARREIDRQLRGAHGRFNRAMAMIHGEAEQKRKAGDQPDRVAGLIESRIQSRARSRGGPPL